MGHKILLIEFQTSIDVFAKYQTKIGLLKHDIEGENTPSLTFILLFLSEGTPTDSTIVGAGY
ncbi:MAG TPA: hypothetical protein VFI73_10780 [Candidatus Nitrosopolaris sp.]|nr:hypothetical protein [Candidatus Nitrosopolaris sp.]